MKTVIIGGGIAGLTLGVLLNNRKKDVVICERFVNVPSKGHAFLMHEDGIATLKSLDPFQLMPLPGNPINSFSMKKTDGEVMSSWKLDSWRSLKRKDLIRYLYGLFPSGKVKIGRSFSHFEYDEMGKATAAVFENGEKEIGDIFIGADGGYSKVRQAIQGDVDFTPVEVKEIVSICQNEELGRKYANTFSKFLDRENSSAMGFLPLGSKEFVWFIQYNSLKSDCDGNDPEKIKEHAFKLVKNYPPVVLELLRSNDFSNSYIWNTRDFDPLPSFHRQNICLIGDSAHLALPFTSAGTTNAITDANVLVDKLLNSFSYKQAFEQFYDERKDDVASHTYLGRKLKKEFLKPEINNADAPSVPLMSKNGNGSHTNGHKPVKVLYFTDPVCSTCWIFQPLLRKMKLEYGKYLDIEYRMGGLLPGWNKMNGGPVQKPSDAAKHWEEVCKLYGMPLDGDIWIDDPLSSSFPPSIAFKAAQMQDQNKAVIFLRRIQEMLFLEKKNLVEEHYLEKAAFDTGLDSAKLIRDFKGPARKRFKEDLAISQKLGVKKFPTLIFSNHRNYQHKLEGFLNYRQLEDTLERLLPGSIKEPFDKSPHALFTRYTSMTTREFVFLTGYDEAKAKNMLYSMMKQGVIDQFESKNGVLWIQSHLKEKKLHQINQIKKSIIGNGIAAH